MKEIIENTIIVIVTAASLLGATYIFSQMVFNHGMMYQKELDATAINNCNEIVRSSK